MKKFQLLCFTLLITAITLHAADDLHAPDINGNTPLHLAVQQGNFDAVMTLLTCGADPRKKNNVQATPIDIAEIQGFNLIAQHMRDHQALLEAKEAKALKVYEHLEPKIK
jgi:ankyrin repeat protein